MGFLIGLNYSIYSFHQLNDVVFCMMPSNRSSIVIIIIMIIIIILSYFVFYFLIQRYFY